MLAINQWERKHLFSENETGLTVAEKKIIEFYVIGIRNDFKSVGWSEAVTS
jgi:hypothetical protein